jgi:hypothetical protein
MMGSAPRRDLLIPVPVDLRRADGSTTLEYAVNVSPGVLCLHHRFPIPEEERIWVELTLPPSGPTIRAEGRVVWSSWEEGDSAEEAGFYETGAQLSGLDAEVARQLTAYANQPIDRRR